MRTVRPWVTTTPTFSFVRDWTAETQSWSAVSQGWVGVRAESGGQGQARGHSNSQPAIASIVKACVTAVGQISWHPDPSSLTSLTRHDRGQPGTWGGHITGNMGPTHGGVTKRDLFTFTGLGIYNYVWFDAKVSMLILFYIWKELSDSVLTGRCTPWHVTRVTHADSRWITMKGKRILNKERLYFKHQSVWVRWADIGSISPAPETGLMASVFRHWVAPSPLIRAESGPWYFHAKRWLKVVE